MPAGSKSESTYAPIPGIGGICSSHLFTPVMVGDACNSNPITLYIYSGDKALEAISMKKGIRLKVESSTMKRYSTRTAKRKIKPTRQLAI